MAKDSEDIETLRLQQLNRRRKTKGLPPIKTLREAIDTGIYKPRGGYTTVPPKQTSRGERLSKPRKDPNLPDSPAPIASRPEQLNGSERDKSLLAGVIVEELDKEIQALVFAKEVIQRRFQGVAR